MRTVNLLFLIYSYQIRKLYKRRGKIVIDIADVLAILLLVINVHSLLLLIEIKFGLNIGLSEFWSYKSKVPKNVFTPLIALLVIGIRYLIVQSNNKLSRLSKIVAFRKVVRITKPKIFSIIYIIASITCLIYSISIILKH